MSVRTRRLMALVVGAALLTLACGPVILPFLPATPTATPLPGPALILSPTGLNASPTAPVTPIQFPTALPTATDLPTATPQSAWLTGEIRVYPGPLHYSGDTLTIEVAVENLNSVPDAGLALALDGAVHDVKPYLWRSPLRDDVLVFRWAWDTASKTGLHEIKVTLPSTNGARPATLVAHVNLLPADQRPAQESGARWAIRNTACCQIYYVTKTSAARDAAVIDDRATAATVIVERKIGFPISGKPIPLVMIDNVWGNGAFVSDNVVITYVDRDYVGVDLDSVLRHELTHWAMNPITHETPVMLVEGVAVYISGGHYKPEPLPERGAALLQSGLYIPLADLADNFRASQHEIAYAEAGALVDYLAETYSWAKFVNVYGSEGLEGDGSVWLDQAFKAQYHKNLDEIEADFKAWLGQHDPGDQAEDLRLTIELLETIRHYQAIYAPYQEALPGVKDAIEKRAVSEFMREPTEPENIALEAMLLTAGQQLRAGQYGSCEAMLQAVTDALDNGGASPVYQDYLAITLAVRDAGYEAQRIDVANNEATVHAIRRWPSLEIIKLVRQGAGWALQP